MTLTKEEVAELYRYLQHEYVSPNKYPHLTQLIVKLQALESSPE